MPRIFFGGVKLNKKKFGNQTQYHPQQQKMQFEVVIQNIHTYTYERSIEAPSLKFMYPKWIVDTSWRGSYIQKYTICAM